FTDVQVNITVNGNKVSSNTVRVKVGNPEVEEEEVSLVWHIKRWQK
ncbi:hypothetical protein H8J94_08250, partial [Clostridium perfringens]|nr:hypothetical protein [Clostridium perfringens]